MTDPKAILNNILAFTAPEMIADKILARGFFLPWEVENVEQLNNLPITAVVLKDGEPHNTRMTSAPHGDDDYASDVWHDSEGCLVEEEDMVGGLVIYTGEAHEW
jgi:hypothetical protein